ncbi:MAG: EamA family transporter [Elusimicrobia bacterium]|nr:EamA family transporter [Elusimicrobiota bacterium]
MHAHLKILTTAALWSTAGAAIKLCRLNAWQIAGGRSLIAALTLLTFLPPSRKGLPVKTWPVAAAYACCVILFILSNKLTTAANAIFLQSAAPMYIMILSPWLLNEYPSRRDMITLPFSLLGLILIVSGNLNGGALSGNAAALGAGVAFALMIMGLRRLRETHAEAAVVWGNLLAATLLLPLAIQGPAPRIQDLLILGYLGVFQLGLAYILFTSGLKSIPASEASSLTLLEPVLNPLWAYLLVHETPGPMSLAGGALILGATAYRVTSPHFTFLKFGTNQTNA